MIETLLPVVSDSYLVIIPLIIIYFFYRKDNKVYPLILSLVLAVLIVTALKMAIVEPRPCIELGSQLCSDPLQSFPSRHAAIVAVPLLFLISKRALFVPYLAFVIIIGISRVLLNEHYPHDVIAGLVIGLVIAYICLKKKSCLLKLFGKKE